MNRTDDFYRIAAAGTALALGAAVYAALRPQHQRHPPDSAPGRSSRQGSYGGSRVVGRAITIAAPRARLYALWRDPSNLPRFMETVTAARDAGEGRTEWTLDAPGSGLKVVTRLVEDRKDEVLAWRSTPESEIEAQGKVMFRDAPGGRGTEIEALVAWHAPWGAAGHWIAKAFGRDPEAQGRQELKRLKMLIETGEIATSANRASPEDRARIADAARLASTTTDRKETV